jgi:hypothetical protein
MTATAAVRRPSATSKVGAEVVFQVEQSEFAAHTLVLAARS